MDRNKNDSHQTSSEEGCIVVDAANEELLEAKVHGGAGCITKMGFAPENKGVPHKRDYI